MSAPTYTPQLRPLSTGEALDAAFRLFRQRFGTLVVCVLVPLVPVSILGALIVASTDPTAFDIDASQSNTGEAQAGRGVARLLDTFAAMLAFAACFQAISAAYLRERAGAGDSLRYALARFPALLGAYLLVALILILGFVALIVPGIYLAVKLSMTFPAVVGEKPGPGRAISRSWELTRGHWWRIFGLLLITLLLMTVISAVLSSVLGGALLSSDSMGELTFAVLTTIVGLLVGAITYPLWAAVLTVLYYDLRVRNEGLDLHLLAQGVGADASRFETSPERPFPSPPALER